MKETTCAICGGAIDQPKRGRKRTYCSTKCLRKAPTAPCADFECDRPSTARGLCPMHYKRKHWVPKYVDVQCPTCGEMSSKRDSGKSTRRFCSLACRDLWQMDHPKVAPPRAARICRLPANHPVMWCGKFEPIVYGSCAECGVLHCSLARNAKRYCGQVCKRRSKNRAAEQRRATRREQGRDGQPAPTAGVGVRRRISKSKRLSIHERDGWICWLCGGTTSTTYAADDPASPTIDHLMPVALGGTNDDDNLATAHSECNTRRSVSLSITTLPVPA